MRLSAAVYHLKRKAKHLAREQKIPLHEALDRLARQEGFRTWSLLAATVAATPRAEELYSRLVPGDLVLLGARPGHGKTLLSLELSVEALKSGNQSAFFTLEYTEREVLDRFRGFGIDHTKSGHRFECYASDTISADYIVQKLADTPSGTLAVIDYLQLLDQKRENAELTVQVRRLRSFARDSGIIFVFISQIDRSYDPSRMPCPELQNVRLPNPLDLRLFSATCFLHNREIQFKRVS